MDSVVRFVNRIVKGHDSKLFAKRVGERVIVYREGFKHVPYKLGKVTLIAIESAPQFVLALTHNWQFSGIPRDWGWEPIRQRLKDMDWWENERFMEELEAEEEAREEARKKEMKNSHEALMYEEHSRIKKAWSDINTSNLSKK